MKVHLQYGHEGLHVELPSERVKVIEPTFIEGLADEAAGFVAAVREPIGGWPLRDCVAAHERVAIVIPDITRPLPTDRLLPWVFAELGHVPAKNIVVVNGTGSHRVNTPDELRAMVGAEAFAKVRVVNYNSHDRATLALAGTIPDGPPVYLARDYVEADRRIVLGLIKPSSSSAEIAPAPMVDPGPEDRDEVSDRREGRHGPEAVGCPSSGRVEAARGNRAPEAK